ncbi:phage major capsid protein [Thalassotalea sp. SU-HH00458]|uniref:phage major capsid protein n=1 Tax=Thalassotalea sp. SU-HH00458 TaxID=3127657 RepID=UPI003106D50C
MMKKLLELRQQKAELVEQSKTILAKAKTEKRTLSPDESKQAKSINSQIADINSHIELAEVTAAEERALIGETVEQRSNDKPSNTELRAFVQTGDIRSLSVGVNTDGGYTVIPTLDKSIEVLLREESVFRKNATVKPCSSKSYKKLVSVGGTTTDWAAESDTRNETNTSKLEEVEIALNSLYAYPKTTQELLDWSDFDVSSWLSSEVTAESSLKEETAFWNGDGVKKAKGILTYARSTDIDGTRAFGEIQELTSAASGVIDFDDLVTFQHSVAVAYRKGCKWYMSDAMALSLRKIKDGDGNFIWKSALTEGQPDLLLGKPVEITDQVGDEVVFADLTKAYYIIDGTTGTRLIKDNITQPGFVKMHASRYVGGGLVNDRAVKILKKAA